ncbi:flagellar hook-associated protein FlgK [Vallitalea okinawensis]|uniref:flagellar hook-associated protein FlgK n=1 Tax=Vallitalea okinawensis TaxID=2078660 RepID=UPI000CFB23CA|nr:flagellar hook-associated protein FlgK [Vallitalea okinawensis]
MAIMGSSLSSAVSGLSASQRALEVTGHNVTNAETLGYTRQRVNQSDSHYSLFGFSGQQELLVGTGVSIQEVAQIRDMFLDMSYRDEASTMKFYEAQMYGVSELESILGETVGGTSFSDIIGNMWETLNELSKHPEGLEARASFVQSAVLFVDQANQIQDQMYDYQYMLNDKVNNLVDEVNDISEQIVQLNAIIAEAEAGGVSANDYRDERNNLLDRLSEIIDIKYHEEPNGSVVVNAEGYTMIDGTSYVEMDTVVTDPNAPLSKPVWKDTNIDVFYGDIDPDNNEDKGELKGILALRGDSNVDYTYLEDSTKYEEIEDSILMKTMAEFDYLIHHITSTINSIVTTNTYGLDGTAGEPLFLPVKDLTGNADDDLKAGNIMINEDILNDVAKLGLTRDPSLPGDNTVVLEIIEAWNEDSLKINPNADYDLSINNFYSSMVAELGGAGTNAITHYESQSMLVNQINNQRLSIMGVSTDQELTNMIMYQQAYNANAKVITVIDEMIDSLMNL